MACSPFLRGRKKKERERGRGRKKGREEGRERGRKEGRGGGRTEKGEGEGGSRRVRRWA